MDRKQKDNTDITLDVVFSSFTCFSFKNTLRQTPKGDTRILRRITRQRACFTPHAHNFFGPLPQGYWEPKTPKS